MHSTMVQPSVKIAFLWTAMLFVFAYVDIFAFYRADVVNGVLAGEVAGVGFTIDQRFLLFTTLYILIPSLLVAASVMLPRRVARPVNIIAPAVYAITILGSLVGETWWYYIAGSVIEVVILAALVYTAWSWREIPQH